LSIILKNKGLKERKKTMESESSRRKRLNLQKYLILIVAVLIVSTALILSVSSVFSQGGVIEYPLPGPNFEIEGNTSRDLTSPPIADDWESVIPGPSTLDVSGILIQDPHSKNATDTTVFLSGEKFAKPEDWDIGAGSPGNPQMELTNIYIYALLPSQSVDGSSWMTLGMERTKEEGTFNLDFELNQKPWTDLSRGPIRTTGDIVVAFELAGNPTNATTDLEVVILRYDPSDYAAGCNTPPHDGTQYGADFCEVFRGPAAAVGTFGAAIMNDFIPDVEDSIPAPPWGSVDEGGAPRSEVPEFQFAEAAINMTALGIDPGCPGFGSVHAKTRTSLEVTAALKDLAGPISLGIDCEIFGRKFEDLNADGDWDTGEPWLEGWRIDLYDNGTPVANTTTNASGYYNFGGLSDGVYRILETCPLSGWSQTAPSPVDVCGSGVHSGIPVDIDHTSQGPYDFGNFKNVDVTACKVNDLDGDPTTTGDQTAIEDWWVYLSIDGVRQTPGQQTGPDGCYTWENLGPGHSYNVEEDDPAPEWTHLGPLTHNFGPASSGETYSFTFANFENVDVTACKLDDADGNLATDFDQTPIPVWPVALSIDGDIVDWQVTGPVEGGESCYTWENLGPLPAGGYYDVHEDVLAGWTALTLTYHDFEIPPQSGAVYKFTFINNEPPGGCPRTPGYWKNWNACSKASQGMDSPQFLKTIEKRLAGERLCEDGFCLVEDLLDPPLEIGKMDPLGLPDGWEPANGCTYNVSVIVSLLNMRDIDGIPKGKVMAKDPAFKLARNLIAAELNYRAGACTTPDVTLAMNYAYALLANIGFEGDGGYAIQWSKKKEPVLWMQAQQLASYLDRYNNADFCGGDCP
jgi:hypothetical protein